MLIGVTVPEGRNNTFSPDEVDRKSFEEKLNTVFNKDQIDVLLALVSSAEESSDISSLLTSVGALSDSITSLTSRVGAFESTAGSLSDDLTALTARVGALETASEPEPTEPPAGEGENNEG